MKPWDKVRLGLEFWWNLAVVNVGLRRYPLPELIARLDRPRGRRRHHHEPARIGELVAAALVLPGWKARCLLRCLVAFRVIRRQGERPVFHIGIGTDAVSHDTHSWLELDGIDIGPPPGRGGNGILVTYPLEAG